MFADGTWPLLWLYPVLAAAQPWIHSWSNRLQPGPSVSHWWVYKDLGVTDFIPVCLAFVTWCDVLHTVAWVHTSFPFHD